MDGEPYQLVPQENYKISPVLTFGATESIYKNAYLTSPECALNFPLTSNNIPGVPFTLQKGISTAALLSFEENWSGSAFEDATDRICLTLFREFAVNGDVNDILVVVHRLITVTR